MTRSRTALAGCVVVVIALLAAPTFAAPTDGHLLVSRDGGVFTFGSRSFHGSVGGQRLAAPVVGMAATPSGNGYWLVAADGGIFTFGDARFFGAGQSTSCQDGAACAVPPPPTKVVAIAARPDGNGYWTATKDGRVYNYGAAHSLGGMAGQRLAAPVVGMAATPSGNGYWLAAADGGIFTFGDARFSGALAGRSLNAAVVGIVR